MEFCLNTVLSAVQKGEDEKRQRDMRDRQTPFPMVSCHFCDASLSAAEVLPMQKDRCSTEVMKNSKDDPLGTMARKSKMFDLHDPSDSEGLSLSNLGFL